MTTNEILANDLAEESEVLKKAVVTLKTKVQSVYSHPQTNVLLFKIKIGKLFLFLFITKEMNGMNALFSDSDNYQHFKSLSLAGAESFLLVPDPSNFSKELDYALDQLLKTDFKELVALFEFTTPVAKSPEEEDKHLTDLLTTRTSEKLMLSLGDTIETE